MAKAYFVNASPTDVKVTLNTGAQNPVAAVSVNLDGTAVIGPTWAAEISARPSPDVFGGDGHQNEVLFVSGQKAKTRRYQIESTVSTVLDLYFFMFEDTIVGEDATGESKDITITLIEQRDG
ncbi:hypothetical protein KUV51_18930 [Tateyamaria omphalii]|uniref:hypothetical protein n=1 Tax=Tateyamaria omphalii TaxID=299262 RepID=UPI001C9A0387|nr:hypothetical protein [Tateyamaria omphalii]MBY5935087.1 hypothetical protein [Tateyamaria omphalii]